MSNDFEESKDTEVNLHGESHSMSSVHLVDFEASGYIKDVYADLIIQDGRRIPALLHGMARKDKKGQTIGFYLVVENLDKAKVYAKERLDAVQAVLKEVVQGDSNGAVNIDAMYRMLEQQSGLREVLDRVTDEFNKNKEQIRLLEKEKTKLGDTKYESGTVSDDCKAVEARLQNKILGLERLNEIAIGRELKMIELKEEVAELKKSLYGTDVKNSE